MTEGRGPIPENAPRTRGIESGNQRLGGRDPQADELGGTGRILFDPVRTLRDAPEMELRPAAARSDAWIELRVLRRVVGERDGVRMAFLAERATDRSCGFVRVS
jgi:hypothetical protein